MRLNRPGWPLEPLLARCWAMWRPRTAMEVDDAGQPLRGDATVLAEVLGISGGKAARWVANGLVPDDQADQAATSVGLHPAHLWPEWFASAPTDEELEPKKRRRKSTPRTEGGTDGGVLLRTG